MLPSSIQSGSGQTFSPLASVTLTHQSIVPMTASTLDGNRLQLVSPLLGQLQLPMSALSNQTLPNQLLALAVGQQLLLYPTQQVVTLQLVMPQVLRDALKAANKQASGALTLANLPDAISLFFSTQLKLTPQQLQQRLLALSLIGSQVTVRLIQGEPVLAVNRQSFEQTPELTALQLFIPLPWQDKAWVELSHEQQGQASPADSPLKFSLFFDFQQQGQMRIQCELNAFALNSRCECNQSALFNKVQQHWPRLIERLRNLGFNCEFELKLQPELAGLSRHLIDIKV